MIQGLVEFHAADSKRDEGGGKVVQVLIEHFAKSEMGKGEWEQGDVVVKAVSKREVGEERMRGEGTR